MKDILDYYMSFERSKIGDIKGARAFVLVKELGNVLSQKEPFHLRSKR